ncbi:cytochrome b5 domain-containing protein 1 isoform X2 [Syngnathoides biaculeatus]|uniref:cytochrome b5 domain-containing protein 1 isoform X2 n=1 Tax=Syngnathoides biaculeatus TaxID=300417 RepID=UPI002ADD761D|nr:cytochrome b5 domain-containing protein 1 isoform X2 [Syngnathoides biaculeatus]
MPNRPRFFTPAQVAAHNTAADLWVSFLGKVCDLTPLMKQHEGDVLLLPIMEFAGKDISSWFDPETRDVLTFVHPLTDCVSYYTPRGRFVHIPPAGPRSDWASDIEPAWWKDRRYEVCSEETLAEILERYLPYNSHACSYTWKHNGASLDMSKTLSQNDVPDDDVKLQKLRLDCDLFTPAILLHFNDDLTEG